MFSVVKASTRVVWLLFSLYTIAKAVSTSTLTPSSPANAFKTSENVLPRLNQVQFNLASQISNY